MVLPDKDCRLQPQLRFDTGGRGKGSTVDPSGPGEVAGDVAFWLLDGPARFQACCFSFHDKIRDPVRREACTTVKQVTVGCKGGHGSRMISGHSGHVHLANRINRIGRFWGTWIGDRRIGADGKNCGATQRCEMVTVTEQGLPPSTLIERKLIRANVVYGKRCRFREHSGLSLSPKRLSIADID